MKTLCTLVFAALPFMPTLSLAQELAGDAAAEFSAEDLARIDTDKDGRVSRREAATDRALAAVFSQADLNGDGYIDEQEARRIQREKPAENP